MELSCLAYSFQTSPCLVCVAAWLASKGFCGSAALLPCCHPHAQLHAGRHLHACMAKQCKTRPQPQTSKSVNARPGWATAEQSRLLYGIWHITHPKCTALQQICRRARRHWQQSTVASRAGQGSQDSRHGAAAVLQPRRLHKTFNLCLFCRAAHHKTHAHGPLPLRHVMLSSSCTPRGVQYQQKYVA